MANPSPWWKVYSGDEEKKFFSGKDGVSGLCRHPDFNWRSVDSLSKESGLSKVRVEEIITKYVKHDIVVQHKTDPEKWGYWEKVGAKSAPVNVVVADQKDRVEAAKGTPTPKKI